MSSKLRPEKGTQQGKGRKVEKEEKWRKASMEMPNDEWKNLNQKSQGDISCPWQKYKISILDVVNKDTKAWNSKHGLTLQDKFFIYTF